MEERRGVFMIHQVFDELAIALSEGVHVLAERHAGGVHDSQVIAKRLQQLYLARLELH
jgi:hypothetical protein